LTWGETATAQVKGNKTTPKQSRCFAITSNDLLGGVLAIFKPLPEVPTLPPAATLPEQNSSPKKDNLRLTRQPLSPYYVVRLSHRVTHDKLSIIVAKPDILRFLHKLQIAVFHS
jgi:hypothetical protein